MGRGGRGGAGAPAPAPAQDAVERRRAIRAVGSIPPGADGRLVDRVASALGDEDIEVRGEAFYLLVASGADIGGRIAPLLASPSKIARAHGALVLANRGDVSRAGEVARLARDGSATVRSSAMGALGHMAARAAPGALPGAAGAAEAVRSCLGDGSIEVRRSALQAAVHLGMDLSPAERDGLAAAADAEIDRLLALCGGGGTSRLSSRDGDGKNDGGGPGGN